MTLQQLSSWKRKRFVVNIVNSFTYLTCNLDIEASEIRLI